ncbi:MAG: acyl-[acyl-carrier-protein]--UDP-N-acetylglucosamine O-acyltransferase [Legionellales bacterium]|nr:acyl-[acyl-carrier-protein]--UDP-N-acetylglucosamine O-acyltransferase [Legionellales bacterium]
MIHETAIIDPSAKIAEGVEIGAYSVIGADVTIDAGTWVGPHVVICGPTTIGKNNKIYQYASVGADPQDRKFHGEVAYLEIGDDNIFREFCTINRGTEGGGALTKIGNDNLFMAYVHIAHDCIVNNHTIFANNASLAGHVTVEDHAIISGFAAVHQFVHIGQHSFVAGTACVLRDVLPFVLVSGNPGEPHGLNTVGLKRRGFSSDIVMGLRRAYKVIYRQGLTTKEALAELEAMLTEVPEVQMLIDGLNKSERGIAR